MLKLDRETAAKLGIHLSSRFERYKSDRKTLELQWMKNLRQYRGVYDPEILDKIPNERSRVYPRDSRVKAIGFVAKMMEMMFPVSDTNWEINPTSIPSISKDDLAGVIKEVEREHIEELTEGGEDLEITSEEIERAVQNFARKRANNMTKQCADQLEEIDYPTQCKKVLRSGAIYSYGILKGPMVKFQTDRYWKASGNTYEPVEKKIARPVYDLRKVWDIYPDLGARSWFHQEGLFERMIVVRSELLAMADRPEFYGDTIKNYLREHQTGNYKVQDFETDLREMNHTALTNALDNSKYEIVIYYGFVTAHDLIHLGHDIPDDKKHESYLVECWMVENDCIKFDGQPFGSAPHSKYHVFIYGEDEDSAVTGVSLMEDMRDSQLTLCALTRMLMDNAGATAGPIIEVNLDLLARGRDVGPVHAFKTIYREGVGADAQSPAVRDIQVNSHIDELLRVLESFRSALDNDSTLPSWTMGQPEKLGEAFRTSNNMSMMTGGATTITKDITRSFDRFTVSVIQSLIDWNMEFNEREDIKGDFQVRARGSRSLVAKELRGQAIEQFMSTLDDEERALIRKIPSLIERMKARDLPYDSLLVTEEEAEDILKRIAEGKAAQAEQLNAEQQAKIKKLISDAFKNEAMAQEIMAMLMPKLEKLKSDTNVQENESGLSSTQAIMDMATPEEEKTTEEEGMELE